MSVYLIRAGEAGPVKIGHSADPVIRLMSLQIAHYETLRIIRLFHGGEPEEKLLQDRFADLEIRGEWYAFSKAMMGDVGLEEIPIVVRDVVNLSSERQVSSLVIYLNENRCSMASFAAGIGVSVQAAHRYITGQRIPRLEIMTKIVEFTHGAIRPNDFFALHSDAA